MKTPGTLVESFISHRLSLILGKGYLCIVVKTLPILSSHLALWIILGTKKSQDSYLAGSPLEFHPLLFSSPSSHPTPTQTMSSFNHTLFCHLAHLLKIFC